MFPYFGDKYVFPFFYDACQYEPPSPNPLWFNVYGLCNHTDELCIQKDYGQIGVKLLNSDFFVFIFRDFIYADKQKGKALQIPKWDTETTVDPRIFFLMICVNIDNHKPLQWSAGENRTRHKNFRK